MRFLLLLVILTDQSEAAEGGKGSDRLFQVSIVAQQGWES
jgi:hypothetical protein